MLGSFRHKAPQAFMYLLALGKKTTVLHRSERDNLIILMICCCSVIQQKRIFLVTVYLVFTGTYLGTDPLKLCNLVSFRTPFTMDRDLARIPSLFDFVPGTASTSSCLSTIKIIYRKRLIFSAISLSCKQIVKSTCVL